MDLSELEERCVNDEEAKHVLASFRFLMPSIMMDSKILSSQDVSVKIEVLRKALFVQKFMKNQGLSLLLVFNILDDFIERVKASFPEHGEVTEVPEFPDSGSRRMLLSVCQELQEFMFPPRPDLASCCSFGRCEFCGKGEHFYSDEEMNGTLIYTCPKCREQGF